MLLDNKVALITGGAVMIGTPLWSLPVKARRPSLVVEYSLLVDGGITVAQQASPYGSRQ